MFRFEHVIGAPPPPPPPHPIPRFSRSKTLENKQEHMKVLYTVDNCFIRLQGHSLSTDSNVRAVFALLMGKGLH